MDFSFSNSSPLRAIVRMYKICGKICLLFKCWVYCKLYTFAAAASWFGIVAAEAGPGPRRLPIVEDSTLVLKAEWFVDCDGNLFIKEI